MQDKEAPIHKTKWLRCPVCKNKTRDKGLSDAEKVLLRLILAGKRYTRQDFADAIGKSPATVQRYLKHMTELGLIRRDGSNKMGQWIAVK